MSKARKILKMLSLSESKIVYNPRYIKVFNSDVEELDEFPEGVISIEIYNCDYLKSLPELPESLKYLNLNSLNSLTELPDGLEELRLDKVTKIKEIPNIPKNLKGLHIDFCLDLEKIPKLDLDKMEYIYTDGRYNKKLKPEDRIIKTRDKNGNPTFSLSSLGS